MRVRSMGPGRDRRPRRRAESEDDGAYQIDVALSLFAVLLIVLVVIAAARAAAPGPQPTNYAPEDTLFEPYPVRAACVVYPMKQLWLLRGGQALRVDQRRLGRLIVDAPAAGASESGGHIVSRSGDVLRVEDPGGVYRVEIDIGADVGPPSAYRMAVTWRAEDPVAPGGPVFDVVASADALAAALEAGGPLAGATADAGEVASTLFEDPVTAIVWTDTQREAGRIFAALQTTATRVEVVITHQPARFTVWARVAGAFARTTAFRC